MKASMHCTRDRVACYPVPRKRLAEELECSRATIKRIIENTRLFLGAPIVYDRQANGYYYDTKAGERPCELPGLWFNADELYALLSSQQLLAAVEPGILTSAIQPLRKRLKRLLENRRFGDTEIASRTR
ncbi:MAG: transcriptional regulator, partial [Pseudomonadota bacterium]|nr:transcriptional regulator [Pseudomonadota bacterium]